MMFNNFKAALYTALTVVLMGNFSTALAQPSTPQTPTVFIIKKVSLWVNGKKGEAFRIEQPDGTWGFVGVKGQDFDAIVKNETDQPTVLHWHGLIVPNNQDGVPYVTQPPIPAGGQYHYHFKLQQAGTYWMHSHYQLQIQQQMSAPLIIKDPQDDNSIKDVVMLLTDFSYKKPDVIMDDLRNQMMQQQSNMKMSSMNDASNMLQMAKPTADLNDVKYDAYLTNYHTLSNPQIIQVQPGEKVRLRIIDGAASSNFFIHLGNLLGTVSSADGEPIKPFDTNTLNVVMGQRADILVQIPVGKEGVYPILAQGEGTNMQTGLLLATPHAKIPAISETANTVAGAIGMEQEMQLQPVNPLPIKPITQRLVVNLAGNMQNYVWTINGKAWPAYAPLIAKPNARVELVFNNDSDMSHPMHLHGHVFEVTEINGQPLQGAMRDTILIPAHGTVKVQFDTDNPGNWMIHCHVLYHAEGGMMTILNYAGVALPAKVM